MGLELYHLEQMPAVCNAKGLEFETIDRAASRSFCGPCGMACWQGFRPCGQPAAVGRWVAVANLRKAKTLRAFRAPLHGVQSHPAVNRALLSTGRLRSNSAPSVRFRYPLLVNRTCVVSFNLNADLVRIDESDGRMTAQVCGLTFRRRRPAPLFDAVGRRRR
jgi:hypothetical protein